MADTVSNMIYSEKLVKDFEKEMDAGKNSAKDVVVFLEKLEKLDKKNKNNIKKTGRNLNYLIGAIKLTDYTKFESKNCKKYRVSILFTSGPQNRELSSLDDLGLYSFHALNILSKVCKDKSLLKITPQK